MADFKKNALEKIGFENVRFTGGFWKDRYDRDRDVTIAYEYGQCVKSGRIEAIKLNWKEGMPQKPHKFWDSDVAKLLEAMGYMLKEEHSKELEREIDEIVSLYEKSQQPDGYINSHYVTCEPEMRFKDLRDNHELYTAGHLIEAGVGIYETSGDRRMLDVAIRFADYLCECFGPEENKCHGYPGHEEIELALVRLYRTTNDRKYLDLAEYFVNTRGTEPNYFVAEKLRNDPEYKNAEKDLKYYQAHLPVNRQYTAEGHSVRQGYLAAGACDVAFETGNEELMDALKKLWTNMTEKRMYITGGIGAIPKGEMFSYDYDLPNDTAYSETCASVALVLFADRMHKVFGTSEYADIIERAVYNCIMSGVSLNGDRFFYVNPMEFSPDSSEVGSNQSGGSPRNEWFGCACCPPNYARFVASYGGYLYSKKGNTVYSNQFADCETSFETEGKQVVIKQTTDYPLSGKVVYDIKTGGNGFSLAVRVPGWCGNAYTVSKNGKGTAAEVKDGYAVVSVNDGDTVTVEFEMKPYRIASNPLVRWNAGKTAIQYGPFVYCLEEADNGKDLHTFVIAKDTTFRAEYEPGELSGINAIYADNALKYRKWSGGLYRKDENNDSIFEKCTLKFVPYYTWANRGRGEMEVWVNSEK